MNDHVDIELVCELFRDLGLDAERIPEQRGIAKTPDLCLRKQGNDLVVAHCEVKAPRDNWLQELWAKAPPGQTGVGGVRADPIFNRIGRNLLKAARQFRDYPPASDLPTIVMMVNHDRAAGFNDLVEVVTGKLLLGAGKFAYTKPVDPDWVGPALKEIDAVGWVNARRPTRPVWWFNRRSAEREALTSALLGTSVGVRI